MTTFTKTISNHRPNVYILAPENKLPEIIYAFFGGRQNVEWVIKIFEIFRENNYFPSWPFFYRKFPTQK